VGPADHLLEHLLPEHHLPAERQTLPRPLEVNPLAERRLPHLLPARTPAPVAPHHQPDDRVEADAR